MLTTEPVMRRRRLLSWWWDYLAVLAWLLVVFLVVGLPTLLGIVDLRWLWSTPARADVASAALTVIPYLLYLVGTEARPTHATLGKRRAGLAVAASDGSPPALRQIVARNVVKVLPWQLGHMAAFRLAVEVRPPAAAVAFDVLALVLLFAVAGPPLARRRGLHDVIAGTRVDGPDRS
jgi:uncharacterized RDD family membrane protein YckC